VNRSTGGRRVRAVLLAALAGLQAGCGSLPRSADPASDAPEGPRPRVAAFKEVDTYAQALRDWRTPDDVNAWIAAKFRYDAARAMRLSETQRQRSGALPIHEPEDFLAAPSGICVDLSRFAVETLRRIDPGAQAAYLMIEFAPVAVGGNTLRRHWLATFRRDGRHYFFADSKRPGHVAGPYASVQDFVDDYAAYRGRAIVAFKERDSFQRQQRSRASRQAREADNP
jgi:hypothetical protein